MILVLQQAVSSSEGIRMMETCDQSLCHQQLCEDHKVQGGCSLISFGSHRERGLSVLFWCEGCQLSNPDHLNYQPYHLITLNEKVFQFSVFQIFYSFPGLHKGGLLGVGVDSQKRDSSNPVSGRLVSHRRVNPSCSKAL